MFRIAGNRDHADSRSLPQFLMSKFGDGDIEMRTQAIFQAAQHLALVFQRLRVFNVNFERQETDRHFRTKKAGMPPKTLPRIQEPNKERPAPFNFVRYPRRAPALSADPRNRSPPPPPSRPAVFS